MSIFIIWDKNDDTVFRARYAEITGESVQRRPLESETHFMIGSSRVTVEQLAALAQEFSIGTDEVLFVPVDVD